MKYALLGYDPAGSLRELPAEEKRALHGAHRTLHDEVAAATDSPVSVIAHYRFRPRRLVTTLSLLGDQLVRTEGPATDATAGLRAIYLVESDDADAVLDLASRLPAVQMGGTVEVWPLTEPDPGEQRTHRHRGWLHRH